MDRGEATLPRETERRTTNPASPAWRQAGRGYDGEPCGPVVGAAVSRHPHYHWHFRPGGILALRAPKTLLVLMLSALSDQSSLRWMEEVVGPMPVVSSDLYRQPGPQPPRATPLAFAASSGKAARLAADGDLEDRVARFHGPAKASIAITMRGQGEDGRWKRAVRRATHAGASVGTIQKRLPDKRFAGRAPAEVRRSVSHTSHTVTAKPRALPPARWGLGKDSGRIRGLDGVYPAQCRRNEHGTRGAAEHLKNSVRGRAETTPKRRRRPPRFPGVGF